MKSKSTILTIPALNELVYRVLYEAPLDAKHGLKGRYLKAATDQRSAKRFIVTSTREEKEELLAHFNYSFYYVIHSNKMTLKKCQDILNEFKKDKKIVAIKDIAAEGIFVTTDAQYQHLLKMMAKSLHDPSYFMNLELNRQGFSIRKWTKRLNSKEDFAVKELAENDNLLMRTILSSLFTITYTPGFLKLTPPSMKILLYYYIYNNNFISEDEVRRIYQSQLTGRQITYAIKCLLKEYCLEPDLFNEKAYCITGIGVKRAAEFRDSILKSNDF